MSRLLKKVALALSGIAFFEIGSHVGLPGVNSIALVEFAMRGGGGLLGLYDVLVGGGLHRGAFLALGIMPYFAAKLATRIARISIPGLKALHETADGDRRMNRWTRGLTVVLATIQGVGFANFLQKIPGAVAHPGLGFIAQTTALLTLGSIVAMVVAESVVADEDLPPDVTPTLLEEGQTPASPLKQRTRAQAGGR